MKHLRFKGRIESINGPLITIHCFDYKAGEAVVVGTNPMTGQKKIVKKNPYTEVDACPSETDLIGRKVRIIA